MASVGRIVLGSTADGPPDASNRVLRATCSSSWVQRIAEGSVCWKWLSKLTLLRGFTALATAAFRSPTLLMDEGCVCIYILITCLALTLSPARCSRAEGKPWHTFGAAVAAPFCDLIALLTPINFCTRCSFFTGALLSFFLLARSASADSAWSLSWSSFRKVRRAFWTDSLVCQWPSFASCSNAAAARDKVARRGRSQRTFNRQRVDRARRRSCSAQTRMESPDILLYKCCGG